MRNTDLFGFMGKGISLGMTLGVAASIVYYLVLLLIPSIFMIYFIGVGLMLGIVVGLINGFVLGIVGLFFSVFKIRNRVYRLLFMIISIGISVPLIAYATESTFQIYSVVPDADFTNQVAIVGVLSVLAAIIGSQMLASWYLLSDQADDIRLTSSATIS